MAVEHFEGGTVITGPHIELYRLRTLEKALKLQLKGVKVVRGRSASALVKQQFGFKGSTQQVLTQLQQLIKEKEAQL